MGASGARPRTPNDFDKTNFVDMFHVVTTMVRSAADVDRAVTLFHALSDATRLGILDMLREGERCVCELQDELEAAQSRLSFHLRVLKEAGLVTDRKAGRWMYYTIAPDVLAEAHDLCVAMQPKKNGHPVRRACCR